mmetsp:Transcript_15786/g.22872  ORF Transcript_15786/g.22872 Transcript_15786/m.22872 type:complete len:113 (+) Transcript_15786:762-1100(+)|eukprot:CAMPEP_0202434242 /NCGR_PEP_ID=MMETSP1345-20130828/14722_1 /ASSEMBLY_ACC=CAM_ASM_000843 /TAXON_ID=342563 /ORGANISM="Fabrea Fabrea salina" /LENGTH=112 /DNA_ID=CAMNT_0049046857 /DNA_START=696 /DNA_END=1034 /DNA_ORIENTATION=+
MSSRRSRSSCCTVTDLDSTESKTNQERKENADTTDESYEVVEEADCVSCKEKLEYIKELKEALRETLEENQALKSRLMELEAWINEKGDELDKCDSIIEDLENQLKEASLKG